MKNSTLRLTETMNFVRDTVVTNMALGTGVLFNELTKWKNQTPELTKKTLSVLMSQKGLANRPPGDTDRKYRRACILLRCVFTNPLQTGWANQAASVNQNCTVSYATFYENELANTWIAYNSRTDVLNRHISQLKTNTQLFLAQYKLSVSGGAAAAGVQRYAVDMIGSSFGGFALRFNTNPLGVLGYGGVDAINVPAEDFVTVRNNNFQLAGVETSLYHGTDLLFTTQFSGCTYCFEKNVAGTEVQATHIDPSKNPGGGWLSAPPVAPQAGHKARAQIVTGVLTEYKQNGEYISRKLRQHGVFLNPLGGVFKAYGRRADADGTNGYDPTATVIIIGIKQVTWSIWAQIQSNNLLNVYRID